MTVSGFETIEAANARADYYRSRGYIVRLVVFHSQLAGDQFLLDCQPDPNR